MALKYLSGEEVKPGDKVSYGSEPGQIEFVAELGHPETGWYFEQYGSGCMIAVPAYSMPVFTTPDEDLEFVSRGQVPRK
jgi:hypothetical protein